MVAMLDLEDSAADALAPERTDELKAAAQANLETLLADSRRPARPFGARINARGTPYHAANLETVAQGLRRGHELAVLVPKAESADDVAAVARELAIEGRSAPRLYLLIESACGVRRLPELIAAARRMRPPMRASCMCTRHACGLATSRSSTKFAGGCGLRVAGGPVCSL